MLKKFKKKNESSKIKDNISEIKRKIITKNELNFSPLNISNNQKNILKRKTKYEINNIFIYPQLFLLKTLIFYILINPILTQIKLRNLNFIQIIDLKVFSNQKATKIINENYIPDRIYINGNKSNIDFFGYVIIEKDKINNITLEWDQKRNNYNELFNDIDSLIEIDLSNFDTSGVTSMGGMFLKCVNLISINLTNINISMVYNMTSMFEKCESLISLNLSNFGISEVYYIDRMFRDCFSLISLNLSNFKTPNLIKMKEMFFRCESLQYLDISNINTSKIINMNSLFYYCLKLTSINISNFDTKNVQNMDKMFRNCESLISIDLSNMDTSNV